MNTPSTLGNSAPGLSFRAGRGARHAAMLTLRALLLVFLSLAARAAAAAPLDATGLDRLQVYVDCQDRCELGRVATKATCLQSCGATQSAWNKNLDSVINRRDYQLALLEFWDAGQLLKICYESGAVLPKGQCGGSNCLATHSAAECQDADVDGLRAWQETLAGTSDTVAQRICASGSQCAGFGEQCFYEGVLDLSYCKARASATAFHLEKVEENASEVIVDVMFDYAPVPPTVLDLYVQFNGLALLLSDSRALSAATKSGKSVEVRQPGDNLIRVIALGTGDARVIQPGPIAELIFRRKTTDTSSIQFSNATVHRDNSVAPNQAAFQVGLEQDSAWGSAVQLKSASDLTQGHVLVHYDFESAERPISESNALNAANICPLLRLTGRSTLAGDCPAEPSIPAGGASDPTYASAKRIRDRWISQLDALQRGVTVTTSSVPGVNGFGTRLDGQNDHVELPLTFNLPAVSGGDFVGSKQGYSISFWAYQESTGVAGQDQVLYSRNAQASELTQFALLSRLNSAASDTFDLLWLNGSLSDGAAVRTVVAAGLPNRKWTHIGASVDAAAGTASVFVDGTLARTITLPSGATGTCPQIQSGFSKRMTIHEEGDFALVQGTGPESIYFAAAGANGLYGIDAMDPNGLGRRSVLHLLDGSAKDPDYNPVVDRVVYSSNATGESEIWIAHSDGSGAQRVTQGFGSAADGVFARRPRWAPDGSGIVFESNARDVDKRDNIEGAGYQLYFIEYDAQKNEVAIPGPNSTKLAELNYGERVASDDIASYRLTRGTEALSNTHAQWLAGKVGTADLARGELGFTTTDANGANPRARRVRVQKALLVADASKEILSFTGDAALVQNKSLIAARGLRAAGQPTVEKALFGEQVSEAVPAPEFSAANTAGGACAGGSSTTVSIRYSGLAQAASCWDTNRNQACDGSTEDRNQDGQCNSLDCNASEFEGVIVGYDPTQTRPDMASVQTGSWPSANNKMLRAVQAFGTTGIVRIEVTSPLNNLPIPNGTEIARIQFCGAAPPTLSFKKLQIRQKFSVMTSITDETTPANNQFHIDPFVLHDARIQSVTGGEFSPDTARLALAVIFDARPMLMRTRDLVGTAGSDMLTTEPVRVEGLSWAGVSRFYACNWMGAVRNLSTKLYQATFSGALDEVHVVDYVRVEAAYRSESERGHERLVKEGRDAALPRGGAVCADDSKCAPNQLCVAGACQQVGCDPSQPYACSRGRCQRLAVEFSPTEQYACVAECASDATCQERQCANGPCRFCDQTAHTCNECRRVVENVGGLNLEYIQGCPDRNSFACDRGTCVSQCYSSENGESKYLCNSATEYCRSGRCVLYDWNWADISPVTFGGWGEMVSHGIKPTAAISQLYAVEFKALGVMDHGHPPEVLVEGKAAGVFNGDWFDIGRVVVDNETHAEAENKPYVVNTPYPITTLRFRTILPPYENLTNSATGLIHGRNGSFCTGPSCRFAAQGSRAMLGYPAWIPGHLAKCKVQPGGCNAEELKYMTPGYPIALITQVKVKNQEQPLNQWINKVCPYWDGSAASTEPVDSAGRTYPVIYGNAAQELSNQKTTYYNGASGTSLQAFSTEAKGFGLLNCNYVDDTGSVASVASIEIQNINVRVAFPQIGGPPIVDQKTTETENGCLVDVGTSTPRYEACFEWNDGDVSFDPFASEPQPYRTLTLERFRSFGWGNPPPAGDNTP